MAAPPIPDQTTHRDHPATRRGSLSRAPREWRSRHVGPAGTAARIMVGGTMVASVIWGHARSGPDPWAWLLGLVALPAATIVAQHWRSRHHPQRLVLLTGPLRHAATLAAFAALYLTSWYAPPISALSDAALIFYGTTMLVAAWRGYAGCEVLAISNWLLGRDDQIGCLLFEPLDRIERRPATREPFP